MAVLLVVQQVHTCPTSRVPVAPDAAGCAGATARYQILLLSCNLVPKINCKTVYLGSSDGGFALGVRIRASCIMSASADMGSHTFHLIQKQQGCSKFGYVKDAAHSTTFRDSCYRVFSVFWMLQRGLLFLAQPCFCPGQKLPYTRNGDRNKCRECRACRDAFMLCIPPSGCSLRPAPLKCQKPATRKRHALTSQHLYLNVYHNRHTAALHCSSTGASRSCRAMIYSTKDHAGAVGRQRLLVAQQLWGSRAVPIGARSWLHRRRLLSGPYIALALQQQQSSLAEHPCACQDVCSDSLAGWKLALCPLQTNVRHKAPAQQ